MWLFVVACTLPAFAISFAATWTIRAKAPGWGLVDRPNDRKVHRTPIPLGGGLAIWLAVVTTLAGAQLAAWLLLRLDTLPVGFPVELSQHLEGVIYRADKMWAILAAATVLAVMGLLDDLRNLPWQPRLLVQLLVAVSLAVGGIRATV
ncbi:MAG: undecaprenyl/decaprenyl-phosphate alpha-N-acetylglucosaminyl 1-phosphate transferase, partial [Planctomycetota bacterium]|nr:undecaprenyl/decaprenyl-phosphate alpha-N-acetylglucosaminyl 1-phosphate transferase [Planctomycetota bacterium]